MEAAGELDQALERYRRADQLRPSYRLHRHMGRVCASLGRIAEALNHFQTFLDEGGDEVHDHWRDEISGTLATLGRDVGTLRISAPRGAEITVDGEPVGTSPIGGPYWIAPGSHTIRVTLQGHEEFSSVVEVRAGQEIDLDVRLEPESEPWEPAAPVERDEPEAGRRRLHRAWFWGSAGLSAGLLITGGILGGMALADQARFDELNSPDRTDSQDAEMRDVADRGRAYQVSADVLLVTGALGAIAALVLAFFTDFEGRTDGANVGFITTPLPSGAAVGWQGAF